MEVYAEPSGGACRLQTIYRAGDSLPVMLEGTEIGPISVGDILP